MDNRTEPDWEDEFFPSKNKKDLDPYFDEEPDEDDHFDISPKRKRPPTAEESIDRYGFGVE